MKTLIAAACAALALCGPCRADSLADMNAIHPNALGHRIMAYTIAKELGIQPKNSPTLKLPTP